MNDLSRDLFTVMGMSAADKEKACKIIAASIVKTVKPKTTN